MLFHAGTDAAALHLAGYRRGAWPGGCLSTRRPRARPTFIPSLDGPPPPANDIVTLEARSMMVYVAEEGQ